MMDAASNLLGRKAVGEMGEMDLGGVNPGLLLPALAHSHGASQAKNGQW